VLTVVGYSLNDTIIIFDRVRENLRKYRRRICTRSSTCRSRNPAASVLTHGTTIATRSRYWSSAAR